jgi:serpin B
MYLILSEDRPIDFIENTKTITNRYVELSLPKFEVEFNVTLNELLKDLGIQTAFMPYEADFKGMFTDMTENAFISAVEHKSFIQVDEAGTEATAVTGISVGVTSLPTEELISFKADKPFTFVVMDDMNGTVLFMGEYAFVE